MTLRQGISAQAQVAAVETAADLQRQAQPDDFISCHVCCTKYSLWDCFVVSNACVCSSIAGALLSLLAWNVCRLTAASLQFAQYLSAAEEVSCPPCITTALMVLLAGH